MDDRTSIANQPASFGQRPKERYLPYHQQKWQLVLSSDSSCQLNDDVHIIGHGFFKNNNRDVTLDTRNYILTASNSLIDKVKENDNNSINYI